ncbi:MAG: hypothetical protein AAF721_36545 [Myxococcota bacterium]
MTYARVAVTGLSVALMVASGIGCDGDDDAAEPLEMTVDGPIPQGDPAALLDWLGGGGYLDWEAESAVHDGTGPHFGAVRTYFTEDLIASLTAENTEHPAGSATVKELSGSGDRVIGWSVSIKTADDSDDGNGWYWYEYFEGSVIAEGDGISICTGCHAGGRDYVLSPFPLQ